MGYGRRFYRQTVATFGVTVVNGVLFYALRRYLFRTLPDEDYGLFYGVFSFILLLSPLLSVCLDWSTVSFVTRFREEQAPGRIKCLLLQALLVQAVVGGAIVALLFLGAGLISRHFFVPRAAGTLRLLLVYSGIHVVFLMLGSVLLGLQHIAARNFALLMKTLVTTALALILCSRMTGPGIPALAYVAGAIVGVLSLFLALRKHAPDVMHAPFQWERGLITRVLSDGKYLSVAFGGLMAFSQLDTVMLSALSRDMRLVAAYQVAVPMMMVLYTPITACTLNFIPMASTLWLRNEKPLLADALKRLLCDGAAALLPGAVLLAAFSDVLLTAFFGRDVGVAPGPFRLLALGSVFYFTTALCAYLLGGIERPRAAFVTVLIGLAANVACNALLIPPFGVLGAATATNISYAVATWVALLCIKRDLPLQLSTRSLVGVPLVSAAVWAAAMVLRSRALFSQHPVLFSTAICVTLYPLALLVLEITRCARFQEILRIIRLRGETEKPDLR